MTTPPETLDRAAVLSRVGGNEKFLRKLVGIFLADCPKRLATMRKALAAHDLEALAHAAHSVKGTVGIFGAAPVVEAARNLEGLARAGDLAAARKAFAELEKELARFTPALKALVAPPAAKLRRTRARRAGLRRKP